MCCPTCAIEYVPGVSLVDADVPDVGVDVFVGVCVEVGVYVSVGVLVGVFVGVAVCVGV